MKEEILISMAKTGSEKAFRELYELNVNKLYRFLRQFTPDNDRLEDWVQQSFIKAFSNIGRFEGRSRFSTWLFKIGVNEMRNDFSRKNIFVQDDFDEEDYAAQSYTLVDYEWHHDMKWLLSKLDEEKRIIFTLFEVEGYSHGEISEILQISEEKSRTTLSRTKTILRNKWNSERGVA